MDWTRIRRRRIDAGRPHAVWASLDELIRIRFRARDFSFQPRQPVTSILAGRYASRLRGRGLDFEELRRYLPGDDIRGMDWRVTARTRQPHVRVYSEEKDRTVLLVVDQRLNMFFGSRNRLKSVTAAELAALGAWRTFDVGDRAGLVAFNDETLREVRPQRSEATVMTILQEVLELNHALRADSPVTPDPGKLNQALEAALRLARHDTLVVIVSDFQGVDERSERLIARIAAHNDVLGVLVHDRLRQEPPSERLPVSDGRQRLEIDLGDSKLRQRLIADYQEEQQRIARFLRRLSAPLLMIDNRDDVVAQVRRLLGVRGRQAHG
ncbi:MAG TPA: DUF58 domain-containing protein [Gammaproteobacteria bacterium]|nr:DUF58 domain-containing protein [Gammaproteobacteria bacterium]